MDMATLCVAVLASQEEATRPGCSCARACTAKMAEICTIGLHNSYTAENWRVMCNENNVIQKFYHPLRMTISL
jgi:hypothetical protein